VLATTLLVTTLLTVMLAASFLLVSAEQRTTNNSFGTAQALAISQAGMEHYFSQQHAIDTSSTYDSARITVTGGYADVVGQRVRPAGATTGSSLALWVVRSHGVATGPVLSGQVSGTHTTVEFAQLNPGKLPARAALVALNGVAFIGPPAQPYPVSGSDLNSGLCSGNPGGTAADTFAVNVPRTLYLALQGTAPASQQGGIPTVDSLPFPGSTNLYDTTHIDWAGLLAGNFTPDYTIPPGPWPAPGGSTYSVGYVNGNVTLPTAGPSGIRGMLVVTGNVTVVNGTHWDGIIVAGGRLIVQPAGLTNFNLHGMIITGLNTALGQSVPRDTLTYGTGLQGIPQIQWTWCYTQSAAAALSALVPMTNSWSDTWSTY